MIDLCDGPHTRARAPQEKNSPPATRRSFATIWGELDYLCKKIHFWLYTRKQTRNAARYLNRLERVLREVPENDIAIVRQEGLALLYQRTEWERYGF